MKEIIMKLDYGKTFLLGFGFFGISLVWSIYNSYVPVFLARDFGLAAGMVGVVMTLDNIAALFIMPLIGVASDATRTRIGRRMPYLLIGAPIAAIAFLFVPLANSLTLLRTRSSPMNIYMVQAVKVKLLTALKACMDASPGIARGRKA